jgi:hypothetical protein
MINSKSSPEPRIQFWRTGESVCIAVTVAMGHSRGQQGRASCLLHKSDSLSMSIRLLPGGAKEHVRVYSRNRKEDNSGTRYLHYDLLGSIACRSL